jgi:hypothetical protein
MAADMTKPTHNRADRSFSDPEYWDQNYANGHFSFLHDEREKPRFRTISVMVRTIFAQRGPSEIADIGCGEGLLVPYVRDLAIHHYLALDISAVALQSVPPMPHRTTLIANSFTKWDGAPLPELPRILIASEILYYDPLAVGKLLQIINSDPLYTDLIISCHNGRPDKPNWRQSSERLWREMAALGLNEVERQCPADKAGAIGWNIARYELRGI